MTGLTNFLTALARDASAPAVEILEKHVGKPAMEYIKGLKWLPPEAWPDALANLFKSGNETVVKSTRAAQRVLPKGERLALPKPEPIHAQPKPPAGKKYVRQPKPDDRGYVSPTVSPVVTQAGERNIPLGGEEQFSVQHPTTSKFGGGYNKIKPRTPDSEVTFTHEPLFEMPESLAVLPERYQNAKMIPLTGDRIRGGTRLTRLNGMPLNVETHGGPSFPRLQAAQGGNAAWASVGKPVEVLQDEIRSGLEQGLDVYGAYIPMGPTALDQTVDMTNALLQQMPYSGVRKRDLDALNDSMRVNLPDFDINDPLGMQEYMKTLTQGKRLSFVQALDKAPMLQAGFPDVAATRVALTEPDLLTMPGGASGQTIVRFGPESLEPMTGGITHPTYHDRMAAHPDNQTSHLEQPVPFNLLFPSAMAARRAAGQPMQGDLRSVDLDKPSQIMDQETIDGIMSYLQRAYGTE